MLFNQKNRTHNEGLDMEMAGSYSIKVNQAQQTIDMEVKGSFTPEQAEAFHRDYTTKVGSIEPGKYTLNVDCTSMNIITQDMVPKLEHSFGLYKESAFNKIVFSIKENPIVKMQLNRIARNAGLTNAEVVNI